MDHTVVKSSGEWLDIINFATRLYEDGYRTVSARYCTVSRIDITDEEYETWCRNHHVSSHDLFVKDYYRRLVSDDRKRVGAIVFSEVKRLEHQYGA